MKKLRKEHPPPTKPEHKQTNTERTTKRIAALVTQETTENDVFNEFNKYGDIEYIRMIPARKPGFKVGLVKFIIIAHHEKAWTETKFTHREGKEGNNWNART